MECPLCESSFYCEVHDRPSTSNHLAHARVCGCLNDGAECCRPECDCHGTCQTCHGESNDTPSWHCPDCKEKS